MRRVLFGKTTRRVAFWGTTAFFGGASGYLQFRFGGGRLRWDRPPPTACTTTTTKAESASEKRPTLRILSQNTWLSFFAGGSKRKERVEVLLKGIVDSDADIVCLQEVFLLANGPLVFAADYYRIHEYLTQECGYSHFSDPFETLPWIFGQNSGLLIYSRIPFADAFDTHIAAHCAPASDSTAISKLSDTWAMHASAIGHSGARVHSFAFDIKWRRFFSRKGYQFARFRLPVDGSSQHNEDSIGGRFESRELLVFNTHFEHEISEMKRGQMAELSAAIQSEIRNGGHSQQKDFAVCVGDFNVSSPSELLQSSMEGVNGNDSEELYSALSEVMAAATLKNDAFAEVFRTLRVLQPHKQTHARLDHAFLSDSCFGKLKSRKLLDFSKPQCFGSDHFAMFMQIDL